jgi:phosphocarrier protein HPr
MESTERILADDGALVCRAHLKFPEGRGLHGREAAMLIKLERAFESDLLLECSGQQARANSIMSLLSLEADGDAEVTATATGPDADQMIHAVEEFFTTGFRPTPEIPAASLFRRKFAFHFNLPQ